MEEDQLKKLPLLSQLQHRQKRLVQGHLYNQQNKLLDLLLDRLQLLLGVSTRYGSYAGSLSIACFALAAFLVSVATRVGLEVSSTSLLLL